jgi:glycosyltransferase involved in cell wall biosynthesis
VKYFHRKKKSDIKKVLIVCSINRGRVSPFIIEQAESLLNCGVETDYFYIKGKGIKGYLKNLKSLRAKIQEFSPDLIHAHYGFSGLLSCLQRIVPVIVTFHGSDIHGGFKNLILSRITMFLSLNYIFVSNDLKKLANSKKGIVIPCGIDTDLFKPMNKKVCRERLNLPHDKKYILFSSNFDNEIKNYPLAKESITKLNNPTIELIELKNYSRQEVSLLMNAADVCLLTSFNEGSPQFIKESMACNRPIVSTDVGDVSNLFVNVENVFITNYTSEVTADKLKIALGAEYSSGRNQITSLGLDLKSISLKLVSFYIANTRPLN